MSTQLTTGKVRLSYAYIWEPREQDNGKKYQTAIIIPKSDTKTVDKIKKAIEEAAAMYQEKFGDKLPKKYKHPLRDGDEERDEDPNYADSYFLNASSTSRPAIVNRERKPITDEEEVYSGCFVRVALNLFPYKSNGNKGVGAGLGPIQKVADGDKLAGGISAEDAFNDDFDEFEEDESDLL